ncbi:MAG: signal peptide peptidase SppA [Gemmatimonadetes bacterium]|nr:signal peptide peptidase SppA [Gemmatimonadota bacterium]
MKQFFAALAANLVTVALCVVLFFLVLGALAASAGETTTVDVRSGSVLVVDLDQPLSDRPAPATPTSRVEQLFAGGETSLSLRAAIQAIRGAADDERISGILLRGTVGGDGVTSGFAALRELRGALVQFRATSKKPVHAWLVNPDARTYYVASAADVVSLDPFGALLLPGLASEQVFLSGLFEKLGIGVQVSRVGRFKAAVEPYTRADMSPENRLQVQSYLGDLWSEMRRGIAATRRIDTTQLQTVVDATGWFLPADAKAAGLIDRIAYYDEVLDDLRRLAGGTAAARDTIGAPDSVAVASADSTGSQAIPQVSLEAYAPLAAARARIFTARQSVAIVYAEGDIVDGEGGEGLIGGDALARELRRLRAQGSVKAVVLRVNSPGGSAIASEAIHRELSLLNAQKPLVVSMGSLAASGGYWISTAGRRVFAEPNTLTGSIGVFSLVPNIQRLANTHGVTFDTVKTGRYADLLTIARPRTAAELAVLQRGTDAVYDAFLARVATSRKLSRDSVAAIAEGRVWSGQAALRLGLVDSLGDLEAAVQSAAKLASLTGSYDVREYPRTKSAFERLTEMIERKPAPLTSQMRAVAEQLTGTGPLGSLAGDLVREFATLAHWNDPRGMYARLPVLLRVH